MEEAVNHVIRQFVPSLPAEFSRHLLGRLDAHNDVAGKRSSPVSCQVKREHIGRAWNSQPAVVEAGDLPVVDNHDRDLCCVAVKCRDRLAGDPPEPRGIHPHGLLAVYDLDNNRHGGSSLETVEFTKGYRAAGSSLTMPSRQTLPAGHASSLPPGRLTPPGCRRAQAVRWSGYLTRPW